MLKNYIKVALRAILRYKGYSLINVVGLAIGMACCLIILIWVLDELSYDRFHENANHIYRVEQDQHYSGRTFHVNVTPYPMAEGCTAEIPDVVDATPFPFAGTLLLRHGEKAFFEQGVFAVKPAFLRMFSFPLIKGTKEHALQNPNSIVITEEMAAKYFGDIEPIGNTITINNQFEFTVTGVLKDLPTNTILSFDVLVPFEFLKDLGRTIDQWGWNSIVTFVQLHEKAVVSEVNGKITELRHSKVLDTFQDDPDGLEQFKKREKTNFMLNPLIDVHLHSYFGYSKSMGFILYVYIVTVIAAFVLLIACINFMNLSTARSANRAKEVGLRKVVGAMKGHLIRQFYGESILLAFIAMLIAILLVLIILPGFNTFVEKEYSIMNISEWQLLLGMMVVTLFTGIISGSYPALLLSSFQPVKVLSGALSSGSKGAMFRKVLVVFQFTLSITLIIATIVMFFQIRYMKNKELGYEKEHLVYIPLRGDTQNSYEVLKNELLKGEKVINVTGTNHTPTHIGSNSGGAEWDGKDPNFRTLISFNAVDFDYVETMKIDMIEGRTFSKEFSTDTSSAFLVNEEVVKLMGTESAVNKRFEFLGQDGKIVGVMKNFHFQSVSEKIEPLALYVQPRQVNYAVIRLQAGEIQPGLDYVKNVWLAVNPNYPFDYKFVEDELNNVYKGWSRLSSLLKYFTIVAIFIACLGLFGLASFTAEQRTKEMGVRKVLGASIAGLVILMSREFAKWVLIANIIAWPVAYFTMNNWLQSFAYRIDLSIWIFLSTAVLAFVIAILTVSYQSIKVSLANPVKSLRYE